LTNDQLNSADFMNRLVDVVPDANMVYKDTSPLTFSEAYRQFLLDVKIEQGEGAHSAEQNAHIQYLENTIQNDMNQFLAAGDRCYAAYENHLLANNLRKISYTFDSFAPTHHDCVTADNFMIAHEQHSKELATYLDGINPNNELFRAIGKSTELGSQGWSFNKELIQQFAAEQSNYEASGQQSPSRFQIIVNMMRYYFKQDVFGGSTQLEESCVNAHLDFNALGWREVPVSPNNWYSQSLLNNIRHRQTNSGRNYFGQGGMLQRVVEKLVVTYKPTLKFTVTSGMKQQFLENSQRRNYRALELGPFVYDRVDFTGSAAVNMIDQYTMTLTSNTHDPQVVGYKTRTFEPNLPVNRLATNEFAFCRREEACATNTINLVPLHQYTYKGFIFQKLFTTNYNELGGGNAQWTYDGPLAYCFPGQEPNTVPLHRYRLTGRYLYTTNWNELGGGRDGWVYEGMFKIT
jgi:hypothetical protein